MPFATKGNDRIPTIHFRLREMLASGGYSIYFWLRLHSTISVVLRELYIVEISFLKMVRIHSDSEKSQPVRRKSPPPLLQWFPSMNPFNHAYRTFPMSCKSSVGKKILTSDHCCCAYHCWAYCCAHICCCRACISCCLSWNASAIFAGVNQLWVKL